MFFRSLGPDETRAAASALGRHADVAGLVVALTGPLGAGKTLFVKGLAEGLGVAAELVASPTFVIANEYPTELEAPDRLIHVDLYRVESMPELENAGLLDWLDGEAILAVEWSDRHPDALPPDRLEVRIDRKPAVGSAGGALADASEIRELNAEALGPRAEKALASWREALAEGGVIDVRGEDR